MLFDLIVAGLKALRKPAIVLPRSPLDPQRIWSDCKAKGAHLETSPGCYNWVYREGVDWDTGEYNRNERDKWNDTRLLLSFTAAKQPVVSFKCQATTTPGYYYDVLHVIGWGGKGAALIATGQQHCWKVGLHHAGGPGAHEALIQTGGECTVYRDVDRSFERKGQTFTGWYGINHHSTGPGRYADPNSVGPWSAGCLVARQQADHERCMWLTKQDRRHVSNPDRVIDATVLL